MYFHDAGNMWMYMKYYKKTEDYEEDIYDVVDIDLVEQGSDIGCLHPCADAFNPDETL